MSEGQKDSSAELKPLLENILAAVKDYHAETSQIQCRIQTLAEDVARACQSTVAMDGRLDRTREDLYNLKSELANRDKSLEEKLTKAIDMIDSKLASKANASDLASTAKTLDDDIKCKADLASLKMWVTISGIISGLICFSLGYIIHP